QAAIGFRSGDFFLGVHAKVIDSPSVLLKAALALAADLPAVNYGIGYHRRQSNGPSFYAVGCGFNTDFSDPSAQYESRRIGEWGRERRAQSRHLTGMFRGAYPASILSDDHVEAVVHKSRFAKQVPLGESGIGMLKLLKEG